MSNVCCKEFVGWIKSFTKIERALTVLEAVLLVVLISLLILLILHFIACAKSDWTWQDDIQTTTIKTAADENQDRPIEVPTTEVKQGIDNASEVIVEPSIKCSWSPSAKTTAEIRYYEDGHSHDSKSTDKTMFVPVTNVTMQIVLVNESIESEIVDSDLGATTEVFEDLVQGELSEGENAEYEYDKYVLALVKLKPPKDIIFGCTLTIVSEYWTLTAASCIEAIEETDSLDSFIMIDDYGSDHNGPIQPVDDVQIHPLYEGKNRTYDLAALKSAGSLTKGMGSPIELTSYLDFALLPLAEKFIILGYGAYRTIASGPGARRLRRAHVYKVPGGHCAGGEGGAALRHLGGARAAPSGACGPPTLCAAVLRARALPCNYCAGTPLLRARPPSLLGLMAASEQCGAACEPALYVTLADVDIADWVDATLRTDLR